LRDDSMKVMGIALPVLTRDAQCDIDLFIAVPMAIDRIRREGPRISAEALCPRDAGNKGNQQDEVCPLT